MAKLTRDQLQFLKRVGVATTQTFDASGLKRSERELQMKLLGKKVAYGVSPCRLMGHTLKDKYGHCPQCHPATLAYQNRKTEKGHVYIAWSKNFKVVKVGVSKDAYLRERTLNKSKYAGISDWEMKLIYECSDIGEVETKTRNELSKFLDLGSRYQNGNVERTSTEIYSCTLRKAMKTLESVISQTHTINSKE